MNLEYALCVCVLGQVNQERDWDLPQALCATDRCHWQREREPKILRY